MVGKRVNVAGLKTRLPPRPPRSCLPTEPGRRLGQTCLSLGLVRSPMFTALEGGSGALGLGETAQCGIAALVLWPVSR